MGLRAAAFLTAGIARVPCFVVADGAAILVGVTAVLGLAYLFTDRLMEVLVDVRRVERWLALLVGVVALVMAARWRSQRLAGESPFIGARI
jgi:membrane protein DedA with SNARE-associated domain